MKLLKRGMKLLALMLVFCMALSVQLPAAAKDYSYRVRFLAGGQGSFNAGAVESLVVIDSDGQRKAVNTGEEGGLQRMVLRLL